MGFMGELDNFRRRTGDLVTRSCELKRRLENADLSTASTELVSQIAESIALLQEMQLKLTKGEHFVSAIFEGSLDGFVLTDANYRFIDMNAAAASLFGRPKEELIGRRGSEFAAPGYDAAQAVRRVESAGQLVSEFPLQRPDGEPRLLEFAVRMNILPGINFAVMRDVTERQRLSEQLWHAQKMEAIGALAGGIAHDFNNLLSIILSYTDLITLKLSATDALRPEIAEIGRAGERAAELTHQLLAFSRKQILQPKLVDLNRSVTKLETMLRRVLGEHVELTSIADSELWQLYVDPGQLEQVIVNLVINARDAMPYGGKLTIETANVELDQAYADRHVEVRPGSYVMLAVTDTGVGMDKSILSKIFEPFFTTKEEGRGTGLGLSSVFGIIKQSGGSVWVDSEVGRGTTFKVYLPRAARTIAGDELRPAVALPAVEGGPETVLLVEDDEQVRVLVRTILRRKGYNVLEARNGGEAFLVCEKYPATIHLLLTDLVMPLMSGRQLAERLTPTRPEMKVLYMSGYTNDAAVHQDVLAASVAFLQKPLTPNSLLRKVREVLDAGVSSADTNKQT